MTPPAESQADHLARFMRFYQAGVDPTAESLVFQLMALGVPGYNGSEQTWFGFVGWPTPPKPDGWWKTVGAAVRELDGKGGSGVHYTLNPVHEDLYARAAHQVRRPRAAQGGGADTATAADVVRRRHLLVDVDPVRRSGISATGAEKAHARAVADAVRDHLAELGWPAPAYVDTGNGYHLVYAVDLPADDGGLVDRVLKALAARFDTPAARLDTAVGNANRMGRLPGTWSRKGSDTTERPHRLCRVVSVPAERVAVTADQLRAVAAEADGPSPGPKPSRGPSSATWTVGAGRPACGHGRADVVERCRRYVAKIPPAVSGQRGHDQTYLVARVIWNDFGLDEADGYPLLVEYSGRCHPPWSEKDLRHKWESAVERGPGPLGRGSRVREKSYGRAKAWHRKTNDQPLARGPAPDAPSPEPGSKAERRPRDWDNPIRLARVIADNDLKLVSVKKLWFEYLGTHYSAVSDSWIEAYVRKACEAAAVDEYERRLYTADEADQKTRELQAKIEIMREERADPAAVKELEQKAKLSAQLAKKGDVETVPPVTRNLVGDVTGSLRGVCQRPDDTRPNVWLKGTGPRALSCANGLLDLDGLTLSPHDPDYFSLCSIPVRFDATAPPPDRFLRMMTELMEGDEERIAVVQELFGVCLDPGLVFKHFAVFTGNGDNGKSVVLTVLRALLGTGNHASVSLQQLSERFGTWPLFGRLANLVGDQSYIESSDEGRLKEMTGGDPIAFEPKGKDVILALNTAKMIFSCNTVPTFSDKSDGVWNRLVVVPFGYTVPKARQNPNYLKAEFWADELPGVLNWAIAGLVRFRMTGRLSRSLRCEAAAERHRLESNPAKAYLLEHYIDVKGDAKIPSWQLYDGYRIWAAQNGISTLLSSAMFGREVGKTFPYASQPDSPVWVNGRKGRVWLGLCERPCHPPNQTYPTNQHKPTR